jgi:hypothetical protein
MRGEIGTPDALENAVRNILQDFIAGAISVVDFLEMVQTEIDDCHRAAIRDGFADLRLQAL